ncbi:hypothetical protein [Photobacterium kishitanii]|uniref:hypothetical protein n=1 Tax=Photobacterium kishitanii TaxID=318456 RepID=UPI0004358339|nr:hypothetical protein [Photobacterium kishitanii]CEO41945.1 conserved hypothetical protein [Photobacterium kishitanii]
MLEKQIYALNTDDLAQHPVWFFPRDDSVEDEEFSVRPCCLTDEDLMNYQIIVKTIFTDCEGEEYVGYIYWSNPPEIGYIQPVLFTTKEDCISFWYGIRKPDWASHDIEQQSMRSRFPITFRSDGFANLLPPIFGTLEGIYYFDKDKTIQYI